MQLITDCVLHEIHVYVHVILLVHIDFFNICQQPKPIILYSKHRINYGATMERKTYKYIIITLKCYEHWGNNLIFVYSKRVDSLKSTCIYFIIDHQYFEIHNLEPIYCISLWVQALSWNMYQLSAAYTVYMHVQYSADIDFKRNWFFNKSGNIEFILFCTYMYSYVLIHEMQWCTWSLFLSKSTDTKKNTQLTVICLQ